MWFTLGLVSFSLVLAWQVRHRWRRPWSGGLASDFPGPHESRWLSNKAGTYAVEVGVRVPDFFRFELKRETWVDRFFKWLGMSVEKQFGDQGFDRWVYVASNDEHLLNRVADSKELRTAAHRLVVLPTAGCRVRHVRCAHGWLVMQLRRGSIFRDKQDTKRLAAAEAAAVPLLLQLGAALQGCEPPESSIQSVRRRDPYLLPAALVLATSTALAIHGGLFLLRPLLFDNAFLLDSAPLVRLTLWIGSLVLLGLLVTYVLLLARSARAHLYLLELLLVGSFGAYSTAAGELREANMEWDVSAPILREALVQSKSTSWSRRSGTRYFLHVRDWSDTTDTRSIKVSRSFYESTAEGRALVFEERAGYFNAAWARLVGAKAQEPSNR